MQLPIDGLVRQQHIPSQSPQPRIRLPDQRRVRLAHGLQILHQRKRVRVLDNDIIDIDREQLEPGFLQQAADVAHVGEGGDVGGDAAAAVEVGELQGSAEFEEGVAAEDGGEEGGVRFQDRGDLGEEGREVVDPVEGEGGEHGGEGVRGEGEGRGVWVGEDGAGVGGEGGVEGEVGVAVEEGGGPVGGGEGGEAGVQGWVGGGGGRGCGEDAGDVAGVGAEVEDGGEMAVDVLDRYETD